MNIEKALAALRRMTVGQLREKYAEVFGEPTNGRHRQWLIKRIAWRVQAQSQGGLTERAKQRAAELADESDLRRTPPKAPKTVATSPLATNSDLQAGSVLTRQYKGDLIQVTVLAEGFEYLGERYKSLTGVAKAVTGKHWNGFHFFGLKKAGVK